MKLIYPYQRHSECKQKPIKSFNNDTKNGDMVQAVEHLLWQYEGLSLNPSPTKKIN
jgi:hypothetical protein